jgi:phasin family protein
LQSRIAPQAAAQRDASDAQAAPVQPALRTSVADVRSLVDIACKTQIDSLAVLGKRVAENVEEWKALLAIRK